MDLETLKAQHPDVFNAAVKLGTDEERDRVCGHLKMGESCGAMETAVKAIRDGAGMTHSLNAEYISAAVNTRDTRNRAEDEAAAAAAANGAGTGGNSPEGGQEEPMSERVADAVLEDLGAEAEA